jgi:hypothetical protein
VVFLVGRGSGAEDEQGRYMFIAAFVRSRVTFMLHVRGTGDFIL